jgi:glycosyltransferase involved in cell wall biosynthesis
MKINKVLALCLSPDQGGLELYFIKLIQHYKNIGYKIHVGCTKNSYISNSIIHNKIECTDRSFFKYIQNFFKLRRYIISNKLNILHVSWAKDIFIAVMLKLLTPGSIKIIFYRQMKISHQKKTFYHKFFYRHIDLLLVITDNLKEEAYRNIPIDKDKVIKLTYGISKPKLNIAVNKSNFFKNNNIDPKIFSIGVFSRVEEQKGQHLVLDAMNMSSNKMQLCIIGHVMSNQYREDLLIKAKIYHLTKYLKFINFVNSPMSYMPFFDLVILPTYEETFGLVVAEAMIMGVPAIGSNAGGVPEIITHGKNGLLFETKNMNDLSEKIDMIFESKTLRDNLVSDAYEYAYKEFDYDRHFISLEKVFNSV